MWVLSRTLVMATDNVQISNSALTILGGKKIVAMNDPSVEARECNANYDLARRAVLRDHPWNFAALRVDLTTPDVTAPVFGYTNRFPLPADFLRIHTIFDTTGSRMDPETYQVEGAWLLTDEGEIWLKYVYNLTDTTKFDPLFDEALAAYLAMKIAFKITNSDSNSTRCGQMYHEWCQKAKFQNAIDNPATFLDADVWIRSRFGHGSDWVRDPGTN